LEAIVNASQITHGLKVVGLGQSMVLGVAIIAITTAYLYANRQHIEKGLFG
jgi:hypothetical protein